MGCIFLGVNGCVRACVCFFLPNMYIKRSLPFYSSFFDEINNFIRFKVKRDAFDETSYQNYHVSPISKIIVLCISVLFLEKKFPAYLFASNYRQISYFKSVENQTITECFSL
ncbi:hypothetical protein EGR_05642 [Echinococcus granulosus]|uniref:Uncharacterized protein n=1 Tax=Echinococcus granulosus TaxID=6210 RepID=W6UMY2_ECHGR|nr:hypothetical protein EGR_05642 [Echinococcus granulosus]EUB59492.1 hypothetical protein EGR_05642 [Echinococcus granulosus]